MDYQRLREMYKPTVVKYLLIAESPPRSQEGRFFYNPELEKWDFLFKSIMIVVGSTFLYFVPNNSLPVSFERLAIAARTRKYLHIAIWELSNNFHEE